MSPTPIILTDLGSIVLTIESSFTIIPFCLVLICVESETNSIDSIIKGSREAN